MLLNELYTLKTIEISPDRQEAESTILLNRDHPVFGGHFPGNPIMPGVCTLQIIRELLMEITGTDLRLISAGNIKYLGFINPLSTPEVQLKFHIRESDGENMSCSATVSAGGSTLCSFKGEFRKSRAGDR